MTENDEHGRRVAHGGTPGPDPSDSLQAVIRVLKNADYPKTVGDITGQVNYTRRTVHSRVKELKADGVIEFEEIGGSKAYFMAGRELTEHRDRGQTKAKSEGELEPERGHKGPPIARKLFSLFGMGNHDE